jgi:hypothetical protein
MLMRWCVAGLLLAGSGASASSETPLATASAPPVKPGVPDPAAIRCERQPITGSRVRSNRVCKTNAQWEADSNTSRKDFQDSLSRAHGTPGSSGD